MAGTETRKHDAEGSTSLRDLLDGNVAAKSSEGQNFHLGLD